jgi:hypothetical protein
MKRLILTNTVFLMAFLIQLSNCGGTAKKEENIKKGDISTLENYLGCIELTLNVIALEYIFNLKELPIYDNNFKKSSDDLLISDKYFEQKLGFYSVDIRIDSVYIEFCTKEQFVGNCLIDSIDLSVGKLLIDSEKTSVVGKIDFKMELPLIFAKGAGEITIDSDSLYFSLNPIAPTLDQDDKNAIKFSVRTSYKQSYRWFTPADSAILTTYCSIDYVVNEGDIKKKKENILLLGFRKDNDHWILDSTDKNLVDLLANLPN